MRARQWCCGLMERRASWVLALGIFGMVGFIGSVAFAAARWVGESGFLTMSALALSSYSVSLLIGHLGDPFEFRRRYPTEERRTAAVAVVPMVAEPQRSVSQPLVRCAELAPLRSVRTTVGHT